MKGDREPRLWTRAATKRVNPARAMAQMEDDDWTKSLQVGGWWRPVHEHSPAPVRTLTPEEIEAEYGSKP